MAESVHTTNYFNTFLSVADDCAAPVGMVPSARVNPTMAWMQYQLLADHPYCWTSDVVLFTVAAMRNSWEEDELVPRWAAFFSQGQACFRASPLTKIYGWGVHFNPEGKMALVPRGSTEYERLRSDQTLTQLKAMRSSR